jgi:hypothetical protein
VSDAIKQHPFDEKYGSVTRRTLIHSIMHTIEEVALEDGRKLTRAEAYQIAMEASIVVGGFIKWVEQFQKAQLDALYLQLSETKIQERP